MIFIILTTSILIYIGTIGYISIKFEENSIIDAKKLADSYVREYAYISKSSLDADIYATRTMSQTMEGYLNINPETRRIVYNNMLRSVLENNPHFVSVWDSWELMFIDSLWNKPHGRLSIAYYRLNDEINIVIDSLDLLSDNITSTYYKIKISGKETITNPYFYSYTNQKIDEILETSLVIPIINNDEFVGLTGIDVSLERFQNIIDTVQPFKNSYAFMVANNGTYVAHPNKKYVGKLITAINPDYLKYTNIIENVQQGKNFSFILNDQNEENETYITFAPIIFGKTQTPWSIGIVVPLKTIMDEAKSHFNISVTVGIIGLLLLTIVIWIISTNIVRPLIKTTNSLKKLSKGHIGESEMIFVKSKDEIGDIAKSVNVLIQGLNKTANFANEIGKGNFNAEFKQLSDKDTLGNSILEMRNSLQTAKDEETKRKTQERNFIWSSEGIGLFGKILRQDNDNIEKLSYNIISNLVSYLKANIGGFYLINEKDETNIFFELIAFVGFNKIKYNKKEIYPGENLVGRCIQEKETIFVNDIPDKYIIISSGLGSSNPSSILIVPLIHNEELIGIVEIESLKNIEKYQITFVEKVSEIIASTILKAKINVRTNQLLEQSQTQADELAQQEEEMRQNMEEMQATQEEASKKEVETRGIIEAINSSLLVTEYDMKGKIILVNDKLLEIYNVKRELVIGKQHSSSLFTDDKNNKKFKAFWEDMKSGKVKSIEESVICDNKTVWLSSKYTPLINKEGEPYKVLKTSIDISNIQLLENKLLKLKELKKEKLTKSRKKKIEPQKAVKEKQIPQIEELFGKDFKFQYINLTYINKVFKGDLKKIQNILTVYIKTIPDHIEEFKDIYKQKKWKLLQSKANSIKSKMGYLGLIKLQKKSKIIYQKSIDKKHLAELPDLIAEIEGIWKKTEEELIKIIKL
ncbi:MAG: GAF domain-containing protein [Bacteroidales bacterium]|nr:GAF domain-containing protein [Bacteroidales bacterium]